MGGPAGNSNAKSVDALRAEDFQTSPVWRFSPGGEVDGDETFVLPVKRTPVSDLGGKIVGTQVVLANGLSVWAMIGNVKANNSRMTEHFLSLSLEREGHWFHVARYFDFYFEARCPEEAARFLGMHVDDVFPVVYDIRKWVKGDAAALAGKVLKDPPERLELEELMALSLVEQEGD